jgi:hypothetical protein
LETDKTPSKMFKDRLLKLYLFHKFRGDKMITKTFLKRVNFEKKRPDCSLALKRKEL